MHPFLKIFGLAFMKLQIPSHTSPVHALAWGMAKNTDPATRAAHSINRLIVLFASTSPGQVPTLALATGCHEGEGREAASMMCITRASSVFEDATLRVAS